MQKSLVRKSLVIGIIVLFVGASIVPNISGDIKSNSIKDFETEKLQFDKNEVASSSLKANSASPDDDVQYPESVTLSSETSSIQEDEIMDNYGSIPLYFTENNGQFHEDVLFQTHAQGATVYLCKDRIVSVFNISDEDKTHSKPNSRMLSDFENEKTHQTFNISYVTASFIDANKQVIVTGEGQLSHYNNYFIGNNPDQWYTDVPNYKSVYYQDIFPGIDLKYYSDNGCLKYDFIVSPRGNPSSIQIEYSEIEQLTITMHGDLNIRSKDIEICEKKPLIYQMVNGKRQEINGGFNEIKPDTFSFKLDEHYNPELILVIDPGLEYSTYLGGISYDHGYGVAVDSSDCAYITGFTYSSDFPTVNAYDNSLDGEIDVFVTKFSSAGNSLEYSTYLGGTNKDYGIDVAVDSSDCAYITGRTQSSDFPTVNAYDNSLDGEIDVFVTKFSSAGNSLEYSTYLGGTSDEYVSSVAVDSSDCAYIKGTTYSSDFPTVNAYDNSLDGDRDVFVTKFSSAGNSLEYSTYLGGTSYDFGFGGVAVDSSDCAYITGFTYSSDFPTVNAYDNSLDGEIDVFVTKFSSAGNSLEYSTYLGGTNIERGNGVAVDSSDCAYITGLTGSSDFPMVNAYDSSYDGEADVFVTKFSSAGNSLEYSTYLGGTNNDEGWGLAVDNSGCPYITGRTQSSDFPTVNAYDNSLDGVRDVFVTKFSSAGNSLEYSTYLGGTDIDEGWSVAVDGSGCAYITGWTYSSDFPTVNAYDNSFNGYEDVFVTKLEDSNGNQPPTVEITYPDEGQTVSGTITIMGTADDPDGTVEEVEVKIDEGDWQTATGTTSWSYEWDTTMVPDGFHTIWARSYDGDLYSAEVRVNVFVDNEENDPPYTPDTPTGPTELEVCEEGTYTTSVTDPEGDMVQYRFDWDDGTTSEWTAFVNSGTSGSKSHSWSTTGTYHIKAQARDEHGATSGWSDYLLLEVTSDSEYITRKKIIEIAEAFESHDWNPTDDNIFHNTYSGKWVDTPDRDTYTSWPDWRGWKADELNIGVPYQWGGFSSLSGYDLVNPEDFDEQYTGTGAYAGDIHYAGDINCEGNECIRACGVDCSGFVSRCWNLKEKYSTNTLSCVSHPIKFDELKPGDILNNPGSHVILFKEFVNDEKTNIRTIEANVAKAKVTEEEYTADESEDGYSVTLDGEISYQLYSYNFISNSPPDTPFIDGPTSGNIGTSYGYTFTSTDIDEDDISYYIDWGDGDTEWTGFSASGTPVIVSHTWAEKDTYTITAKAKDEYGLESDWATLEVEMPVNQQVTNSLLQMILERFPNAFPILRYLLGL